MKITVIGTGYVGLSLATLLARKHEVRALDISEEKVNKINNRISPIIDHEIEDCFRNEELNLKATLNKREALEGSDYIIIATPTNYDEKLNYFDTSSVEDALRNALEYNPKGTVIIKSTVPVGYTLGIR